MTPPSREHDESFIFRGRVLLSWPPCAIRVRGALDRPRAAFLDVIRSRVEVVAPAMGRPKFDEAPIPVNAMTLEVLECPLKGSIRPGDHRRRG
jgi:hypothetical protein